MDLINHAIHLWFIWIRVIQWIIQSEHYWRSSDQNQDSIVEELLRRCIDQRRTASIDAPLESILLLNVSFFVQCFQATTPSLLFPFLWVFRLSSTSPVVPSTLLSFTLVVRSCWWISLWDCIVCLPNGSFICRLCCSFFLLSFSRRIHNVLCAAESIHSWHSNLFFSIFI